MSPFVSLAFTAILFLLAGCASITPPPRGEKIVRSIEYAQRPTGNLHLDLYLPATKPPYPTVLWIHGGGWKYGHKAWMLYVRKLTRDGFAIASIQYRLSHRAKFPAQIEDAREAFHWLQAHGARYGLRTDRMFLSGASAGGHLAALLGVQEGRSRIAGVCLMYPATNLTGFPNPDATKGYLPELLGGSVNQNRALAESGSPTRFVRADAPPFLIYHGDSDALVPLEQSRELDRKLAKVGVESELNVLGQVGHGFSFTDAQLDHVAKFFRRHDSRRAGDTHRRPPARTSLRMAKPLLTVPHVDLPRYMGDWRVIANIPYFAEKGCVDSVESYALRADGDIDNWFTYRKKSFDAPQKKVTAKAVVFNRETNAEWRVKFFFGLIRAKYSILALDPDYQWVAVGHPSRDYGWVMAREKTLPEAKYQSILQEFQERGYDIARFQKVPQPQ